MKRDRAGNRRGCALSLRATKNARGIRLLMASALLLLMGSVVAKGVHAVEPAAAAAKGTSSLAISRHVIAGGGGKSSGGVFAIQGTIGQPDADPLQPSSGGVFAITGGFWPGIEPPAPLGDAVFADGFE